MTTQPPAGAGPQSMEETLEKWRETATDYDLPDREPAPEVNDVLRACADEMQPIPDRLVALRDQARWAESDSKSPDTHYDATDSYKWFADSLDAILRKERGMSDTWTCPNCGTVHDYGGSRGGCTNCDYGHPQPIAQTAPQTMEETLEKWRENQKAYKSMSNGLNWQCTAAKITQEHVDEMQPFFDRFVALSENIRPELDALMEYDGDNHGEYESAAVNRTCKNIADRIDAILCKERGT